MTDFNSLATIGVQGLRPYQPGKPVDELEREYGVSNAVKLASNENPLGPGLFALAAARDALQEIWLYPDGNGFILKEKISGQQSVSADQITLGNGSSDLLDFAIRVFASPDSEVLFSAHSFAIYPILTQAAGAKGIATPATNWGADLDALRAAVTGQTALVFIANPNNPTGTWLAGSLLESFIRDLPDHVMVVVDEAYYEYANCSGAGADGYSSALAWVDRYPNLIVTRTFSKCYGLAGLRAGYSVSHPQVADLMNRVRPPFNVNNIALAAASAALDDEDHVRRSVLLNIDGMAQLTTGFIKLGLDYIPSVGNFVCVDLGREAAPVFDALLYEGIIVRPVANYGMPHHLRITVGTSEQNIRVLNALQKVL